MSTNRAGVSHRRQIAGRHRDRAYECLRRARKARAGGDILAARGYVEEARTWARFANACLNRPLRDNRSEMEGPLR